MDESCGSVYFPTSINEFNKIMHQLSQSILFRFFLPLILPTNGILTLNSKVILYNAYNCIHCTQCMQLYILYTSKPILFFVPFSFFLPVWPRFGTLAPAECVRLCNREKKLFREWPILLLMEKWNWENVTGKMWQENVTGNKHACRSESGGHCFWWKNGTRKMWQENGTGKKHKLFQRVWHWPILLLMEKWTASWQPLLFPHREMSMKTLDFLSWKK